MQTTVNQPSFLFYWIARVTTVGGLLKLQVFFSRENWLFLTAKYISIGEAKLEKLHGYQVLRSNRLDPFQSDPFSHQKTIPWNWIWGPYQVTFNDHFGVFAAFCGQLMDLTFYSRYNTAKHGLQLYYIGISRSIGTTCRRQPVSSAARGFVSML